MAASRSNACASDCRVAALPFGEALEFAEPGEIRAFSLKIFDRSFAVTYLLETVAIVIGLSVWRRAFPRKRWRVLRSSACCAISA